MMELHDAIQSMQNEVKVGDASLLAENDQTVEICKSAIPDTIVVLIKSDRLQPFFMFAY